MKKLFLATIKELLFVLKDMSKMFELAFKIAAGLLVIPQTVIPIYSYYIDLAAQVNDVEAWVLGDLSAIFTVLTYILVYALIEIIIRAFDTGYSSEDNPKIKEQNKKADFTKLKAREEAN